MPSKSATVRCGVSNMRIKSIGAARISHGSVSTRYIDNLKDQCVARSFSACRAHFWASEDSVCHTEYSDYNSAALLSITIPVVWTTVLFFTIDTPPRKYPPLQSGVANGTA